MALTKINGDVIEANAISSTHLASGAVTHSSLSSITTDNVSEGSTNLYHSAARARSSLSVTGGNLSYDSGTGVLQLTTDTIRGAITAGTGVTYSAGQISIGQDVSTTATPTFGNITTTGYIAGPATFTIDPAAVGDNTGTVVIAGNLQVDGTTTTINSTTMTVDDLNITLASGAANAAAANGAGITVDGASATITYDGTNDEWDFNKDINVAGQIKSVQSGGTSFATTGVVSDMSGGSYIVVADPQNVVDNTLAGIQFSAFNGDSVIAGTYDSTNNSSIVFGTETSGTITEKMRINSSGKVGIGAVPIQAELHVVDSLTGNNSNITTSSPTVGLFERNGDAEITILGNAANHTSINFSDDTHSAGEIRYVHGSGTDEMRFYTASTQRAVIDSSGNVGIGTDVPSANLHVSGGNATIYVQDSNNTAGQTGLISSIQGFDSASTRIWGFGRKFGSTALQIDNDQASSIIFNQGGSEIARFNASGNLGIGTSSPSRLLDIENSTAAGSTLVSLVSATDGNVQLLMGDTASDTQGKVLYDNVSDYMSLHANGAERMRINSSGKVGIGTDNPQQLLQVDGNIYMGPNDVPRIIHCGSHLTFSSDADLLFTLDSNDTAGTAPNGNFIVGAGAATNTNSNLDFTLEEYAGVGAAQYSPRIEYMRINGNGYMGLNTTQPAGLLHVNDSSASGNPSVCISRGLDGGRLQFRYQSNTTGVGEIGQTYYGTGRTRIWFGANLESFDTAHAAPTQQDTSYASWYSTVDSYADQFTIERIPAGGSASKVFRINSEGKAFIGEFTTYEAEFPNAAATLHLHQIESGGGVAFGDETSMVISTGCSSPGAQGYQGSLWFGTSDHPAAGSAGGGNQYVWRNAGIASTSGANDTGGGTGFGNLEFFTNNNGSSGSKRMTIDMNGSIGAPTGTNIYNASDERLKQNITSISNGLGVINSLNPVKFNWINNFVPEENDKTLYGFIAQEVQEQFPDAVENFVSTDITVEDLTVENPLRVNEKFMIPMLVKAVQELNAKLEAAEARITELEG